MTYKEIIREIEDGEYFWHWPTGLMVFHDKDFDDEDTFGITVLDRDELLDSDFWSAYSPSNDDSIKREDIAVIISTYEHWHPVCNEDEDEVYINAVREYGCDYEYDVWRALYAMRHMKGKRMSAIGIRKAHETWDYLEDVPVDDCGCLIHDEDVPHLGLYEKGTEREEIWHDIEDRLCVSVAYLMGELDHA